MTAPLNDPHDADGSTRRDLLLTRSMPGTRRRISALLSRIWAPAWFLVAGTDNIVAIWPKSAYKKKRRAFRVLFRRIFVISDPEEVEYVMLTRVDNFRKSDVARRMLKPLIGESMFISHGEHWKRQRRIATPAFHSRHVRAFTAQMVGATREMRARWEPSANGNELEISREMTRVTADVICRTMFSDDLGSRVDQVYDAFSRYQASLGRLAIAELTGLPAWLPRLQSPSGHKAAAELDAVVSEIIARRRAHPGTEKDLLSLLLEAVDPQTGERLSDRLVRDEVLFLFLAGHETTANAMVWLWYLLSQSPEVERRVHEEVDRVLEGREPDFQTAGRLHYLRAAIQETLRLYPPVHTYAREAVEDDRFGDQHVPAGSLVVVSPWVIHRHEQLWDAPDVFDPERFLPDNAAGRPRFAYLPFGAGPRTCLGMSFAMTEMTVVASLVAQRYRLRLRPGHPVDPLGRLTLRPRLGMPMTLHRRH